MERALQPSFHDAASECLLPLKITDLHLLPVQQYLAKTPLRDVLKARCKERMRTVGDSFLEGKTAICGGQEWVGGCL